MNQSKRPASVWSYLFPKKLRTAATPQNPLLELYYHRGQYVLSTGDAVYSDGDKYRPVLAAFKIIGSKVNQTRSALLLGCGLASTLHILAGRGVTPDAALVDVDKTVLQWAMEFLPAKNQEHTVAVCQSAEDFIRENELQFDLVVSDVFEGRHPVPFVSTDTYLRYCRDAVAPGGFFILNYISYDRYAAQELKEKLRQIFGNVTLKSFDYNYVFVTAV